MEEVAEYEVKVSKGFTEDPAPIPAPPTSLRPTTGSRRRKNNMVNVGGLTALYCGASLTRMLRRKLAVILERDALKWFKPAKGQFLIFYRHGADHLEYQPDFVAETESAIYMLEPKASNQMNDPVVLAKKEVAVKWCVNATEYAKSHGGKPWRYVLIPHDGIAANMTLSGLAECYSSLKI